MSSTAIGASIKWDPLALQKPMECWIDPLGVKVYISALREDNEHVIIPNGDKLSGPLASIRTQLARRGFLQLLPEGVKAS